MWSAMKIAIGDESAIALKSGPTRMGWMKRYARVVRIPTAR
jgi:hypothetical protein